MSNFSNGINNGANTPVIYQTTDANRPTAPLAVGSLFISQTSNILQRWDGSGWVTVGGSGTGSVTSVNGQTGVVVLTTTDIAEGINLYYTDARARAALSAGSGISYNSTTGAIANSGVLSFNGSTGAITYTAPVTSVNGQTGAVTLTTTDIAEGTNLYYTNARARGALSAGSGISYNQTTGQITNSGVLSVNGQTGAVTITTVTSVNGQTGVVVLTTTNIAEGTNLYYTDARARAALSAGSGISYNQTTGQITNSGVLSVNGQTGAVTISSAVTSVNGQTGVVVLTTTDIAEGTNLYYTDARARAALSAGSGISYNSTTGAIANNGVLSFNGSTGAITYTAPVTSVNGQAGAVTLTTTNIAEGTNLYYTDGRARAALSGGTGVTYNSTTGTIAIGQSVATSATPVFAGVQANSSSGLLINNSAGTLVATFGSANTTNASIVGGLTVGGVLTINGVGNSYIAGSTGFGAPNPQHKVVSDGSGNAFMFAALSTQIGTPGNWVGYLYGFTGNTYQKCATIFESTSANGVGNLHIAINNQENSSNVSISDAKITAFSNGNVAIGKSTALSLLDINGIATSLGYNANLSSGNSLAGTLTGTGTNVGAQWKFVSDNNTTGAFIGIAAGESTGDAVFAVGANKKLVFGVGSSGTSRAVEIEGNTVKIFETAGNTSNWVRLGAVGTGTNTWLFGAPTTGSGFTLKTDTYLNATVNGTAIKIALLN